VDYIKLLERSAKMIWEHKILWLFGFLTALGGCGGYNSSFQFTGGGDSDRAGERIVEQVESVVEQYLPLIIIGALILLFFAIIFLVIAYVARGGLIAMADAIDSARPVSLPHGVVAGGRYALRLFFIDLVLFGPFVLVLSVLVAAVVLLVVAATGSSSQPLQAAGAVVACLGFAVVAVLLVVLIPVGIFLSVLRLLAHRHAVLSQAPVFDSIRLGYSLIRRRFADVAIVWLMRLVVGIIITFVLFVVGLLVLGIPTALLFFNVILGAVLLAPGLLLMVFLSGIVEAFTSVLWTLAFRELTAPLHDAG